MKIVDNERGFEHLIHPTYAEEPVDARLASRSSAVGNYEDSFERPGTSFLWIGDLHHLDREEVSEFVKYLKHWLKTGYLK